MRSSPPLPGCSASAAQQRCTELEGNCFLGWNAGRLNGRQRIACADVRPRDQYQEAMTEVTWPSLRAKR